MLKGIIVKSVMNKKALFLVTIILLMIPRFITAQNTWVQKADFADGKRFGVATFSIGTKGYVCCGSDNQGFYHDLWEYDPSTNSWVQKADLPAGVRRGAVAFSIGNKGYVGTGYGMSSLFFTDFWEYDQPTDTWTQIADYPGEGGVGLSGCVGFSIGNKGYVGTGGGWATGSGGQSGEFWEYDPSINTWSQKADFPGGQRWFAIGFSIGNKGYLGTGLYETDTSIVYCNDFWEYDASANSWTQKASFTGLARTGCIGLSLGTKGYIGPGRVSDFPDVITNDFWEWNQSTNTWTQLADYPGGTGNGIYSGNGFAVNSKIYLGLGGSPNYQAQKDFWEYTPDITIGIDEVIDSKSKITISPNPFSSETFLHSTENLTDATYTISNTYGMEVKTISNLNGQIVRIEKDNLQNGIYFIRLTQNGKLIATNKIIISE